MNIMNKIPIIKSLVTVLLLQLSMISVAVQAQDSADIIFQNGKIITVNGNFDIVDSLAITTNKIVAVGKQEQMKHFIGEDTKIIDLKGRTILPGLIDNHLHFMRSAWSFPREARLDGVFTRKEALAIIKKKAEKSKDWVLTLGGFTPDQFEDSSAGFSVEELDTVAPNTPVYLQVSYRSAYANSTALKLAGITPSDKGLKVRSFEGKKLSRKFGGNKRQATANSIREYMTYLNSFGLTTVYDVGRPSEGNLSPLIEMAEKNDDLPLRVFYTLRYRATNASEADEAITNFSKLKPLDRSDQVGMIGLGEHIYAPVSDSPKRKDKWQDKEWKPFADISIAAAKQGWPIHEHTMSNVTIGQYLTLIEDIAVDTPEVKNLRWTLAHVNGIDTDQIQKATDLGVALGVHSQAMMSKRKDAPSMADIANSKVLWGLGSDGGTVSSVNPFLTLWWAISGKNISNSKGLTETISRKKAIQGHTINNAKLLFMEDKIGSLEIGKLADFIVIDEDFMNVDADEIRRINPVLVVQNGKFVHDNGTVSAQK